MAVLILIVITYVALEGLAWSHPSQPDACIRHWHLCQKQVVSNETTHGLASLHLNPEHLLALFFQSDE